jgi:DNA-binding CsgD family transcriptional regulator
VNTADARTGWGALFRSAFRKSRNPMLLVDERRRFVDVNGAFIRALGYTRDDLLGRPFYSIVVGGPQLTEKEWADDLAAGHFGGEAELICADDTVVVHQWDATAVTIGGPQRLVLGVALSTSRWGSRFRRDMLADEPGALSDRELEIVHLVALGSTGREIADELGIAHDTVRTHVRNAMGKIGARSRAHLVAKALGEGHALNVPAGQR